MAKKVLTARFCETVKPPATGRKSYSDAAMPGFRLRVQASGRRSFSLVFRGADGMQRRLTWPCPAYTLAEAHTAAEQALRAVARGEIPGTQKRAAKAVAVTLPGSVSSLCDIYIEQHLKKNVRRWEWAVGQIENHIRPQLGALRLDQIERGHVRIMLSALEAKHPIAANRTLQRVKALFNWAIDRDLIEKNPTLGLKKPAKETPRTRILTDPEIAAVWNACDNLKYPGRDFARLLMLSGQRRDDLRLMHWTELDLDAADWTIPSERYKSGRDHLIPLTETMVAMLKKMPFRDRGGFVFSASGGDRPYANVSKPKKALDTASGVTDWVWHDLRRTFRSGLSRLGIRPDIAERVLGHSVGGQLGRTYDVYQYREEKLHALEAWGSHVQATLSGGGSSNVVALRAAGMNSG